MYELIGQVDALKPSRLKEAAANFPTVDLNRDTNP